MGKYYRDREQLFDIYGHFLRRILQDEKIGPRMARTKLIIQFIYTDPDCEVTIDLKNPPSEPGYYGSFRLGPCELKPDVWSRQSADHSHSFWHGLENPVVSIGKGKIKQGGQVVAMLKLLPVVKPTFKVFPLVLEEMGLEHLVLSKR